MLLSNGAGLVAGMWLVHALELRSFDWTGREKVAPVSPHPLGQLRRLFSQILQPYEFNVYEWAVVEKPRHLLGAAILIVVMEVRPRY